MSLNIGMIGLDTSHAEIFTRLLHDNKYEFGNAKVIIGCPYPSPDFELSIDRVQNYTNLLKNTYNVTITDSVEEVAKEADAIIITAVDGRKHKNIFEKIAPYKKPTFVDKPMTTSVNDTNDMFNLSNYYNTPIMSTSSLRYANSLQTLLNRKDELPTGIYLSGPLPFVNKMPYYFWYGIHMIEMLFTLMGTDYKEMTVLGNNKYDIITTEWSDHRFGIIRGDHNWHGNFEALLHYEKETILLPVSKDEKPFYACLLERIISFFKTGINPVPEKETIEIIRFIEIANRMRKRFGYTYY